MKFIKTPKRERRNTEATTGPYMLVTVKGNRISFSPSVVKTLGLEYEYAKAKGDSTILKKGNNFIIHYLEKDGIEHPFLTVDNEEGVGYKLGKNEACSAPDLVLGLVTNLGKSVQDYYKEPDAEGNTTRSFNMAVNIAKPVTLYVNDKGDASFEPKHGYDELENSFYELAYLGDNVRSASEEDEDEKMLKELEAEEAPKAKKGKKAVEA